MKTILSPLLFLLLMTLLTGIVYPALAMLAGYSLWFEKSAGNLVYDDGVIKGGALIAQKFSEAHYFWPRPSASDYSAVPSGASNLGPSNKDLGEVIGKRRGSLALAHHTTPELVPEELITASASGLDPHVSKEAILFQMKRVKEARKLSDAAEKMLTELIEEAEEKPFLFALGKPVVNVLLLNLAMDRAFGKMVQ